MSYKSKKIERDPSLLPPCEDRVKRRLSRRKSNLTTYQIWWHLDHGLHSPQNWVKEISVIHKYISLQHCEHTRTVTTSEFSEVILLVTQEAEMRRMEVQSQPQANSLWDPILKKPITKKGLVEWLKVQALSSNPSTAKKINSTFNLK
jgi:hypothetical protein